MRRSEAMRCEAKIIRYYKNGKKRTNGYDNGIHEKRSEQTHEKIRGQTRIEEKRRDEKRREGKRREDKRREEKNTRRYETIRHEKRREETRREDKRRE